MKTLQRTVPPVTPLPNNGAARPPHFVFDYPLKNDYGRVHLLSDLAPTPNSGKFLSSGSIYSALLKKISEPLTDGTAGQILATDGNGNRYWKDDSGMTSVTWESILNKPASFPPSTHKSSHATGAADAIAPADIGAAAASHTHAQSDVTGLVNALDSKASASALSSHTGNTSNPHSVTKSQVGLGNVDNTSDMAKPVSTAVANAIVVKADAETGSAQEAVITFKNDESSQEITVNAVDNNTFSVTFLDGCRKNGVSLSGVTKTCAELMEMSELCEGYYDFSFDFGNCSRVINFNTGIEDFFILDYARGIPGPTIGGGIRQVGNVLEVNVRPSSSYIRTDRTVTLYKSVPESISSHDSSASAHSTQFASKITNPSGGNVGDVLSKTAFGTSWIAPPGGTDENAVHYTADSGKSTEQKAQARTNIGAASSSDLTSHTGNTSNPHSVTKGQIGLGDVDNTSDMAKPISAAVASALYGKQDAKLYKWDIPQGHGITYTTGYSDRLPEEYVELYLSPSVYNPDVGGAGRVTKENGTYYWSPNLFRLESYPVQAGVETIVLEEALSGKYTKPSGGIPSTDMTSAVQTSLGKADTALQTHQDISGKLNKGGDTMTGILYFAKNSIKGICDSSSHHCNFYIGWWEDSSYMTSPQVGIGACTQSGLSYKLAFYKGTSNPSYLLPDGSDVLTKTLGDGYYSPLSHSTDSGIHVTSTDKTNWNGKSDITLMAPAYSSSSTYRKDAWVTYNGLLYQAKQDISTAEAWTAEHWTQKPAMTTPDARLISNESENHMYMTEVVDGTDTVKWSDEYRLTAGTVSNNSITVRRGEITSVTLADGSTPLQLAFSEQDTGFARDFMVAVTLPTTAVTGIQPLALPSGIVRVWTQDDPWNSYDVSKDLGKTFLYCFTDLNVANQMLINRMELKSVPTISVVTGTEVGTIAIGSSATVTGTFLSGASKVEFCSDTTAATPTWTEFTSSNYTVNHAGLITLGTAATAQITTTASGTGGIRVTTGNGTVSKTGLTFTTPV